MQKLIAEWNTDLKLWGNWETDLLSERWEPFLETWPTSGTMRNGQVFELQMPTHPTKGLESSSLPTPRANEPGSTSAGYGDSLNDFASRITVGYARKDLQTLPTPKARDHQAEGYEAGLRRSSPQVGTIVKGLVEGDERVLLRSPKASEGQGGALGEAEARKRGNTVGVRDQIMDLVASQGAKVSRTSVNLPTPTASDIYTGNFSSKQHSEGSLHSVSLAQIVNRPDLLPTPNTMEHREIKTPEQIAELKAKSPGGYRNLRESVVNEMPVFPTPIVRDYKDGQAEVLRNGKVQTDTVGRAIMNSGEVSENRWGKFESAVRLWEQEIEREAPSPTKPDGKEGAHRLSSKFTEWMMGLPEGWITDVGLTRNEELKLAGNGVVPQQAELALRLLLNSDEE